MHFRYEKKQGYLKRNATCAKVAWEKETIKMFFSKQYSIVTNKDKNILFAILIVKYEFEFVFKGQSLKKTITT